MIILKDVARPGPSRWQSSRWGSWRVGPNVVLALTIVVFLAVWEVVSRLSLVDPTFISRPTAVIAAIPEMARDPKTQDALATTGASIAWAIFYGTVAGIVSGYILGTVRVLRDAFYGPAVFLMSVPKSIFIPIFMVVFGINTQSAVYYGAFSGFIFVLINVIGGLDLLEEKHLRIATAYGANWRHRIVDIIFPASLPGVFTGIWYGIKNGLQGILIFELFMSVGGLGGWMRLNTNLLRTDRIFAIVLGVSIVSILLGEGWSLIERRLNRWRPASTATAIVNTEQQSG